MGKSTQFPQFHLKRNPTALGIDPGIGNTGLAVVELDKHNYHLRTIQLITSTPKETESNRLLNIFEAVYEILNTPEMSIEAVAIEKVFHNKNVTSSIKTRKAIGAVLCAAGQHDLPVIELTPQQVKCASGLSSKANKQNLIRAASRLFGKQIATHHEADAAFCAVACILQARKA